MLKKKGKKNHDCLKKKCQAFGFPHDKKYILLAKDRDQDNYNLVPKRIKPRAPDKRG